VVDGEGEGWIEGSDEMIPMRTGVTLVIPSNLRHYFRALGQQPLRTYGIHVSPHRIVNVHAE
jgi:mannose-6-phosphate isomerase-like protein (cupin superfamily)